MCAKQPVAEINGTFSDLNLGFVRVVENLESNGILGFDFPGLESHGN